MRGKCTIFKAIRVFILSGLCLMLTLHVAAQGTEPPYIYYFSNVHGGLIIERADGTDSRLYPGLAAGDVAWSPSGRWFTTPNAIVRTDGSGQVAFSLQPAYGRSALWSPTDDVLLLFGSYDFSSTLQIQIFVPDTETILASYASEIWGIEYATEAVELYWSETGSQAFVWLPRNMLITLHVDGSVQNLSYAPFPVR